MPLMVGSPPTDLHMRVFQIRECAAVDWQKFPGHDVYTVIDNGDTLAPASYIKQVLKY